MFSQQPAVPSVNYHLWQACNMRCRFCFATFQGVRRNVLPAGHLDRPDSLRIVRALAKAGFSKINFAGGEPFLCPWLADLVVCAKERGMITSVVTNGSYFDRSTTAELLEHLDWVVLSVDSLRAETLTRIGRVAAHRPMLKGRYLDICDQVRGSGVKLKINTVVTSANYEEDFTEFIRRAQPRRWKIMQMLPLEGPDSRRAEDLIVSRENFEKFVAINRRVKKHRVFVVPETNEDMVGSYAMIDPAGRFYDNVAGQYRYSRPILKAGVHQAFSDVFVSRQRFLGRGGLYDFEEGGRYKRLSAVRARTLECLQDTATRAGGWLSFMKERKRPVPAPQGDTRLELVEVVQAGQAPDRMPVQATA